MAAKIQERHNGAGWCPSLSEKIIFLAVARHGQSHFIVLGREGSVGANRRARGGGGKRPEPVQV